MPTDADLRIDVELSPAGVVAANDRAEAYAEERGVDPGLVLRLRLVLEELGLNVVKYAGPGLSALTIELAVTDHGLAITLRDDGMPFDPTTPAPPPTPDSLDDVAIGGLGLVMVRKSATSIDYVREDGWNRVRVVLS